MGGIADLAIHRKQPFVSGKFWKMTRDLERQVLAVSDHLHVGATDALAASFGNFFANSSIILLKSGPPKHIGI